MNQRMAKSSASLRTLAFTAGPLARAVPAKALPMSAAFPPAPQYPWPSALSDRPHRDPAIVAVACLGVPARASLLRAPLGRRCSAEHQVWRNVRPTCPFGL